MKRRAALFLFLLVPAVAFAQIWAAASLGSYHLERGDHCEANPGLGFETPGTWRWLGGFYRNSDCDLTLYAGRAWLPLQRGPVHAGVVGALLAGYDDSPLLAAAGLMVTVEGREWGANVMWFPSKRGNLGEGVLGLQVKRTF